MMPVGRARVALLAAGRGPGGGGRPGRRDWPVQDDAGGLAGQAAGGLAGAVYGCLVRRLLELVGQRWQVGGVVAPGEGGADQEVGELGVFRQAGAAQVGADGAGELDSFAPVAAVAVAADDLAEGLGCRAEVGAAAVVLKAGE